MLSTANITMQFGPKPLFENISVKFGEGNRYGLIGANGCGKSTFMKILGGDLEPSSGNVILEPGVRLGKLRQDQFGYENERVLDVVMQGHTEMWSAMRERDAIYANPDADEAEFLRAEAEPGRTAGAVTPPLMQRLTEKLRLAAAGLPPETQPALVVPDHRRRLVRAVAAGAGLSWPVLGIDEVDPQARIRLVGSVEP